MVGRPRKMETLIQKTFKIRSDDDVKLNKILANQYPGGNKEEDRSHIVRLALKDYFSNYYSKVL